MLANPLTIQSNQTNDWPKSRKLIFGICLVIFLYQLYQITVQYYKYETKFELRMSDQNKNVMDLPAITLCTPRNIVFLKSTLKKKYPHIWEAIEMKEQSNSSDKEAEKELIYHYYTRNSQNYKTLFDKSIKDTDIAECLATHPTVWMQRQNSNFRFAYCSSFSPVLESRLNRYGKCFTFFSRQPDGINDVTDLQIDFQNRYYSVIQLFVTTDVFDDYINDFRYNLDELLNSDQSISMFIHDPYRLPTFDRNDAIDIKSGKKYDIRFWSETKTWLKRPYNSCFDYKKNLKTNKPKSMEQCIRNCFNDKSAEVLNCLPDRNIIVNDDNLNDKLKSLGNSHCHNLQKWAVSLTLEKQCIERCDRECSQTEYKFDLKITDHRFGELQLPQGRTFTKFSFVSLRPKRDSDREYLQRPVQSMCSTIHKMMITLLIWFGLSIFSFSSIFETTVNKARSHMYYISTFEDKVTPNVSPNTTTDNESDHMTGLAVSSPIGPMVKPKFTQTNIGSNVKLDHYNDFIAKVVDGYPNAQTVDIPMKKSFQY